MLSTMQQYHDYLVSLQGNPTSLAAAIPFNPKDQKIYNVDLNTRQIESPGFLSVETDHRAEIVYFKFDRFFDNFDLTKTVCLIEFYNKKTYKPKTAKTPASGLYVYRVPFYDVQTFEREGKVVIPWLIEGRATEVAGDVVFALRFYIADAEEEKFFYVLNTIPATGKVLHGMEDVLRETFKYNLDPSEKTTILEEVYQALQDNNGLLEYKVDNAAVYWTDV